MKTRCRPNIEIMSKSEKSVICLNVNKMQVFPHISNSFSCVNSHLHFIIIRHADGLWTASNKAPITELTAVVRYGLGGLLSVSCHGVICGGKFVPGTEPPNQTALAISFCTDNNNSINPCQAIILHHDHCDRHPAIRTNGQINQSIGIWFMVHHQTGFHRYRSRRCCSEMRWLGGWWEFCSCMDGWLVCWLMMPIWW